MTELLYRMPGRASGGRPGGRYGAAAARRPAARPRVVALVPGGPFLYVRLVTAAYAVSAIGRLIPVRRKQVPGYRRRMAGQAGGQSRAHHRA